ncbi:hypothetical protein FRC01_009445, partial [Tulasnella sp. 417]
VIFVACTAIRRALEMWSSCVEVQQPFKFDATRRSNYQVDKRNWDEYLEQWGEEGEEYMKETRELLANRIRIVSHLISIGPPEMLHLENGVGSTPMEITQLQYLTLTLRELLTPILQPNGFNTGGVDLLQLTPAPGMRNRDEKEVKSLRKVIEGINSCGVLANKPELLKALSDFAERSEHEFTTWAAQRSKDEVPPAQPPTNNENEATNVRATFDVFSKAVVEIHQRQLVPLRDVQLAVLTAVESSNPGQFSVPTHPVEPLEEAELGQTWGIGHSVLLGPPGVDSAVFASSGTHFMPPPSHLFGI